MVYRTIAIGKLGKSERERSLSVFLRPPVEGEPRDHPAQVLPPGAAKRHAGAAKVPGLFALARHSGVGSLHASDKARRTRLTSTSLA